MSSQNIKYIIINNLGLVFGFLFLTIVTINPKEKKDTDTQPLFSVKNNTVSVAIPFLQKDFIGFKEALAFKESQGRYTIVSKLGYLGKYQFSRTTLQRFNIYDTQEFLKNPELQEKAFIALCKVNKWILRKDIKRFGGERIGGITITESGILASAHLAGAGNVKKYSRSYGKTNFNDAFGTSITWYMKKFAGYHLSIKADRLATVS